MDVIIRDHHHLQEFVEVQRNESSRHPLNHEIDQWESQSIIIIQRKADELRKQLIRTTSFHLDDLSHRIQQLGEEVRRSSEQRSFIDTDIQNWRRSLEDLREDVRSLSTFSISGLKRNLPLKDIRVNIFEKNEFFQYASNGRVRFEEYGRFAIHDASAAEIELRGKNEYTSGCHEIRFHLVQSTNNWMFLGINSKATALQDNSYAVRSAVDGRIITMSGAMANPLPMLFDLLVDGRIITMSGAKWRIQRNEVQFIWKKNTHKNATVDF